MRVVSHTTLVTRQGDLDVHHKPGEVVEIDDNEARDLIARELARPAGTSPPPSDADSSLGGEGGAGGGDQSGGGDGDDVFAAILALEAGNSDHFGSDGKPKVEALSDLVGRTVTKRERDAAWKKHQDIGSDEA